MKNEPNYHKRLTERGSFELDYNGIWHHRVHNGCDIFDALNDCIDSYKSYLWDDFPGAVAFFWFNQVPCPLMGALVMDGKFTASDLWSRWQEVEKAWNFDRAPNIKDVLDVLFQAAEPR